MSSSDHSGKSVRSIGSWEMLAIPPEDIEIMLTDITEEGLKKVEDGLGVKNLSSACFPQEAFPVHGIIYGINTRLMVDLVCKRCINGSPIRIIFLVDTGSMPSFVSRKTMESLINKDDAFPEAIRLHVQTLDKVVECSLSNPAGHFPDANVLGMRAIVDLGLSIEIDGKQKTFELVQR